MPTGNSTVFGLAYWNGDPTNAAVQEFNADKSTIVIDTANSAIYQKTSPLVDNSGFTLIAAVDNPSGFTASIATTDGSSQTLAAVPIPSGKTVMIEAKVQGHRTGGSSGTAEDSAGYDIRAVLKNISGSATTVGTGKVDVFKQEDQNGWDATIDVSAGNAVIVVNGAANNNVNWQVFYRVYTLG